MNGTKIIRCSCTHVAQDSMHGKGMRVHNHAAKAGVLKSPAWRCTVCSNVKGTVKGDEE